MKESTMTDNVMPLAKEAIKTHRKMTKHKEHLDKVLKPQLRDIADGETLVLEVPGEGKVTIKTPFLGSSKTVMVLNEDKFRELSQSQQDKFIQAGIVEVQTKKTPARDAAVEVKPNV